MNTSTLRSAAALLGAIFLAATLGGQPARAQTASCPCLTGDLIDEWFQARPLSVDQQRQDLFCADDPGFTTFDYLDPSAPDRSIYIDVTYPTSRKPARCKVDLIHAADDLLTDSRTEITSAQARACHQEILNSRIWTRLGCPNN
jgi:hypothetical protein